ncbi:MAG: 6-phosphogluconolactonase [Cellvibrionaceae bacterium]
MAKNSVNWYFFDALLKQSEALANCIAADIRLLLDRQEKVTLSTPGGTTPLAFYQFLSCIDLDWSRVNVVLNDERWVPLNNKKSNEALLRKTLKINRAKDINVVSFYSPDFDIEEAVKRFNEKNSVSNLDICVLGMGTDGHTASLFPNMENLPEALNISSSPKLIVSKAGLEESRVSLNLSSLITAKKHFFLITGETKKIVLEQSLLQKTFRWPVSHLASAVPLEIYHS